jgi:hypothetical protein
MAQSAAYGSLLDQLQQRPWVALVLGLIVLPAALPLAGVALLVVGVPALLLVASWSMGGGKPGVSDLHGPRSGGRPVRPPMWGRAGAGPLMWVPWGAGARAMLASRPRGGCARGARVPLTAAASWVAGGMSAALLPPTAAAHRILLAHCDQPSRGRTSNHPWCRR